MTPAFNATEWLAVFRSRGNDLRRDGRRLVASGPALTAEDHSQIAAYTGPLAAALRAAEPPAQVAAQSAAPASPRPAPEPEVYAFPPHVTRRRADGRVVVERDGMRITRRHIDAMLEQLDDEARSRLAALAPRDLYDATANWIRDCTSFDVALTGRARRFTDSLDYL